MKKFLLPASLIGACFLIGWVLAETAPKPKPLSPEQIEAQRIERIHQEAEDRRSEENERLEKILWNILPAIDTTVERQLTSPSTAKFAGTRQSSIAQVRKDQYRITSYVDSQNGFGAMIRTQFQIVFDSRQNKFHSFKSWQQ
jgi:hypothetical protein